MNMESRLKLGIIIPKNKILGGKIYTPVSDPSLNPREKFLLVSRSTFWFFCIETQLSGISRTYSRQKNNIFWFLLFLNTVIHRIQNIFLNHEYFMAILLLFFLKNLFASYIVQSGTG